MKNEGESEGEKGTSKVYLLMLLMSLCIFIRAAINHIRPRE